MKRRAFLAQLAALTLAGCGFHLRGTHAIPYRSIYVQAPKDSATARELTDPLRNLGVAIADSANTADAVLKLAQEKRSRTILTLSGAGRVREYRLNYSLNYSLTSKDGKEIYPDSTIQSSQDFNLAKQLNILISDMGMPLDRVRMDPTTGALGYGIEYGFSAMERVRQAALQGDAMTQLPILVTPDYEAWKTKEAKVNAGVPAAWGDWLERSINWETLTAMTLIEAGADIVVLRHAESVRRIKLAIADLMAATYTLS